MQIPTIVATKAAPVTVPLWRIIEPLDTHLSLEEADEVFLNAVSEIPTQPLAALTRKKRRVSGYVIAAMLFLICLLSVGIFYSLFSPTVTIDIVPVEKSVTATIPLPLSIRQLAPVTLTKSLHAPTTGTGYQDARKA